jgi:hypothetical protein
MTTLRYIGGSGAYRPDLPSHDVDAAELAWMAKSRRIAESEIVEAAVGSGLFVAEGDRSSESVDAFSEASVAHVEDQNKGLDGMSRDELRAAAKDLDLAQGGSKAELIERIRARLAEAADADATTVATTVGVASDTGTTDVSVASVPIATDTSVASDTGTTETILPRLTKLGPSLPETPQA